MPPGISTTSRRAPCPFCKGQRSGSKPCRVPSAPQPHICFSLFFLIPAFHCLSIAPASSPPTPWHCPSQAPSIHMLGLLSWNTTCLCHTAHGTSKEPPALSLFPPSPLPCPSIPAVPPSPQGKGGADGPRTGSFSAGCSGRSWLYLQEKEKAPCAEPNRELNIMSYGVGSSWLGQI